MKPQRRTGGRPVRRFLSFRFLQIGQRLQVSVPFCGRSAVDPPGVEVVPQVGALDLARDRIFSPAPARSPYRARPRCASAAGVHRARVRESRRAPDPRRNTYPHDPRSRRAAVPRTSMLRHPSVWRDNNIRFFPCFFHIITFSFLLLCFCFLILCIDCLKDLFSPPPPPGVPLSCSTPPLRWKAYPAAYPKSTGCKYRPLRRRFRSQPAFSA